jgi:hypothetical protein
MPGARALGVIAVWPGRGQAAGTAVVAAQAGVPALAACGLKAAIDLDWDDPATAGRALAQVLGLLDQVDAFLAGRGLPAAAGAVAIARQVRDQDVEVSGSVVSLRRAVARDRRISVEDAPDAPRPQDPLGGCSTAASGTCGPAWTPD